MKNTTWKKPFILAGKIFVVPHPPKYTKHVYEEQFKNIDLAISLFSKDGLAPTGIKKLLLPKSKMFSGEARQKPTTFMVFLRAVQLRRKWGLLSHVIL